MVPTAPETETPFRTTPPSTPAMTATAVMQVDSVHVHTHPVQNTSCTCPQATETGSQTRRLVSLEKSQAPTQWKDFCEQTPIDEARHCHTILVALKL